MPMWPQWANDHDIAHLEAETVPVNLIWRAFAQWLLSYVPEEWTDGQTDRRTDGRTETIP